MVRRMMKQNFLLSNKTDELGLVLAASRDAGGAGACSCSSLRHGGQQPSPTETWMQTVISIKKKLFSGSCVGVSWSGLPLWEQVGMGTGHDVTKSNKNLKKQKISKYIRTTI